MLFDLNLKKGGNYEAIIKIKEYFVFIKKTHSLSMNEVAESASEKFKNL